MKIKYVWRPFYISFYNDHFVFSFTYNSQWIMKILDEIKTNKLIYFKFNELQLVSYQLDCQLVIWHGC